MRRRRLLVVASNVHFLDWLRFIPYDVRLFRIRLSKSRFKRALFYATLKPRLKALSYRYDIIFCDFFDEFACLMSHVSSKPIYVRLHRWEVHNPVYLLSANLKNVKAIITVSNHYKRLVEELVKDVVPVYVVPNGVDIDRFSYNPYIHRPLKICTVSNLIPRKRIFDLIVNNPDLNIDIGGKGEEKRILEEAIRRFNLKAKLYGYVKLPEFYHNHDIFVQNSSDEGLSVALIEAMSCGLVPLCFDYPGADEVVPREFIYRSYEELREKISRFNQMSDEQIRCIKRRIRQIVEKKFNLKHQAKKFMSIFEV